MVNTNGLRLAALISLYAPLGCSKDRFPEFHYDSEIGADNVNFYEELEVNVQNGFYKFSMDYVKQALSPEYLKFLKESGYAPNLDSAQGLMIAGNILKADDKLKQIIENNSIAAQVEDNTDYVVNIDQPNARQLVQILGYNLPTAGLMYRLFIPYIKELAQQNNPEAQATLKEMTYTKAEWLDDLVLNKNKVKIGTKEKQLALPAGEWGYFESADLNEFGYPSSAKAGAGEFRYWGANAAENAVIRDRGAVLFLDLGGAPSDVSGVLGVRCAKFF